MSSTRLFMKDEKNPRKEEEVCPFSIKQGPIFLQTNAIMARDVYTQTTVGKALAETLAEFRRKDEIPKETAAAMMRIFYDSIHVSLDQHIDENACFTLRGESSAVNAYQMKLHATVKNASLKTPEGVIQADEIQVLARDTKDKDVKRRRIKR